MADAPTRPPKKTITPGAWQEARALIYAHRGRLAVGLALMLVNRLAGLVLPSSSKWVIDRVINQHHPELLLPLALAAGGATLVQAITGFGLSQILGVAAQRAITDMRRTVQAYVLRLPISYFDSTKSGILISRIMTDAEGIRNLVGTGLVQLVGGLLTAAIALGVLFYLNWRLTLIAILILGCFGVGMAYAFAKLRPLFRDRGKVNAEGTGRLGDFFMYGAFIGLVALPLINIASIGTQITEAFAGLDRIREIRRLVTEDAEDGARAPLADVAGDVAFENVSFEYVPGAEVLKRVSFHAAAGSTTALVGSSGAGKSTLINLVLTFNRPKSGRILVDGRDLATLRLADYRRQLGAVVQDNFLFDGTISQNIVFARPHATREDIQEAARIAHCDEFVRRFEKGYDTVVGERGVKLSGGERQRVSIARAILADPRILILDEATSSLDSESEAAIQDGLRTLRRGRTTFVIAHRLSTIRSADQILVMERGEIVERGTHAELLAKHGRYRQLYDKQYRFEQDLFVNPGEDFTPEPEAPVTAPPLIPPARL